MENPSQRRPLDGGATSGGNGDGALDATLGGALRACMERLQESNAWRRQVTTALEAIGRTTFAHTEGLQAVTQAITRLEAAMHEKASAAALPPAEVVRWEAQLGQLARAHTAQTHNLEQVRLQAEALARHFEKLSQEVIVRQIMDPFFAELARLYEALHALRGCTDLGDEDLEPIRQRIRGFLDDYNVELICPDEGEPVDPRRHQPVRQLRSPDAAWHGRIATTYNIGLVHGTRLIQPARVAVFIFADTASADSPKP